MVSRITVAQYDMTVHKMVDTKMYLQCAHVNDFLEEMDVRFSSLSFRVSAREEIRGGLIYRPKLHNDSVCPAVQRESFAGYNFRKLCYFANFATKTFTNP